MIVSFPPTSMPNKMCIRDSPCNKLAAEFFNGGGHLNASGGEFTGTMAEAKQVFEEALKKYKTLLTEN